MCVGDVVPVWRAAELTCGVRKLGSAQVGDCRSKQPGFRGKGVAGTLQV